MEFLKWLKKIFQNIQDEEYNKFELSANSKEESEIESTEDLINGKDIKKKKISTDINENIEIIKQIFNFRENNDLVIREFNINLNTSYKAFAVFMDGLVNKDSLDHSVFEPLMILSNINKTYENINFYEEQGKRLSERCIKKTFKGGKKNSISIVDFLKDNLIFLNQVEKSDVYGKVIDGIILGQTVIFIDNATEILILETRGWKDRAVSEPIIEKTVRGPHEGFCENYKTNIGLIRKFLPNHNMINDVIYIGTEQKNFCGVIYIKNIANPKIVDEVKKRITSVKTDIVIGSCSLEQYIEDHPFMIFPQTINTERPDRVASQLVEGKVAIIMSNSPNALIVPINFWTLFHSSEDIYHRFPIGSFLRILRYFSALITTFLPALYIAIINFHQGLLPTDLLFSIAGTREKVPFPSIIELLILEISFELIRESGIRMPGVIGPTLGIIGALILGQASVAANIVSPLLIIVVSITGIGSFAIADYSMSFACRLLRFIYMSVANFLGIFGISIIAFIQLTLMCNMKSFGVPYLSPIAPWIKGRKDLIIRYPLWEQEKVPDEVNAIKKKRQPEISRGWVKSDIDKGNGKQ